jgi:hypothetical protein
MHGSVQICMQAWFDARIIEVDRKPHMAKTCECSFWYALYEMPEFLPRDWSKRKLLQISPNPVALSGITTMREAIGMSFEETIAASLPNSLDNAPRIFWIKDGARWYSSLKDSTATPDHSLDEFADYLESQLISAQPYFSEKKPPSLKKPGRRSTDHQPVAGPKNVTNEITYAELFMRSVEQIQSDTPPEEEVDDSGDDDDESGLLPSWNPFQVQVVAPAPVKDPYADAWAAMHAALESIQKVCNYTITGHLVLNL